MWLAPAMLIRQRGFRVGSVVRLHDSACHDSGNAYPLPGGLKDGDLVTVVGFDHGWVTVLHEGKEAQVYIVNIDAGWDEHVGGKWRERK